MSKKDLKDYIVVKNKTPGLKGGILLSKTKRLNVVDPQKETKEKQK